MAKKILAILGMLFMALWMGGCCHPTRLTLTIDMDDALRKELIEKSPGKKLEVDIVGVNANQHSTRWENYSMTQYWTNNDTLRSSVKPKILMFDPAVKGPMTLTADDPIWSQWSIWDSQNINDKNMPRLYVLVQLLPPENKLWSKEMDLPGENDPRRVILPLGDCRWDSKNASIMIMRDRVITLTQYKRDNKNQ